MKPSSAASGSDPRRFPATWRTALEKAAAGDEREIPRRVVSENPPLVCPAFRWSVPPGKIVPEGSAEYVACREIHARGLLAPWFGGQGGYALTAKGSAARELLRTAPAEECR